MIQIKRKPTPPGEILREEFLIPLGITQKQLADHIGCDFKVINRIINEKAQVTPKLAIKLAARHSIRVPISGSTHRRPSTFTTRAVARPDPKLRRMRTAPTTEYAGQHVPRLKPSIGGVRVYA